MKIFVLILGIAIILGCLLFYTPAKEKANYEDEIESVEVTFDFNDPNEIGWEELKRLREEIALAKLAEDIKRIYEYDPNDEIYSYLPEPPGHWKEKYGDVERTRLIHALSEQRIAIALQGKRLKELEDYIATKEWENAR